MQIPEFIVRYWEKLPQPAELFLYFLGLCLAAWLANWITKNVIMRVLRAVVKRSKFRWDDAIMETGILTRMSHIVPALIVQYASRLLFKDEVILGFLQTAVTIYLIVIALMVLDAVFNTVHLLLARSTRAQDLPIKGLIQACKLLANLVGLILMVSVLFDKTPVYILSGLGAVTAVLILIFRDAILGFVAGIQLAANNMVKPGDWIEMPSNQANGDVMDVSLTTVKVRNFDKTITSIPAYDLISKSFINWRGMAEAGGRRIKRAIRLDMRTIRFVDEDLLNDLRKIHLLQPYLEERTEEIEKWNRENDVDASELANGRRMTNLGCFRAYCEAYCRNDSRIRKDFTFLFRQLESDGQGVPLEIYVFTKTIIWRDYESIQSDIFDHLFAVLPKFGLAVFQEPSGRDLDPLCRSAGGGEETAALAEQASEGSDEEPKEDG